MALPGQVKTRTLSEKPGHMLTLSTGNTGRGTDLDIQGLSSIYNLFKMLDAWLESNKNSLGYLKKERIYSRLAGLSSGI